MSKIKVLIQLDTDHHASVFDRIVAVDSGAEHVISFSNVEPNQVEELVHGAMFTRGPDDLKSTAIFIGGRNVARAEEILGVVQKTFFDPLRCSVMLDANGANTTAVAAVLAARRHLDFPQCKALVLGGTGPVGQRTAQLLAQQGAGVWVGSRTLERAQDVCNIIAERYPDAHLYPAAMGDPDSISRHPARFDLVVAAGAAGVKLVHRDQLKDHSRLRVLVDLNAVPPAGIEGVRANDQGREESGIFQYGALGVGRVKMKIHTAAIKQLFESNDQVFDAEEILALGLRLVSAKP